MWTGRAEAYQWGRVFGRKLYDYDWENAYPRIARDVSVPTRLRGSVTNPTPEKLYALCKRYGVVADIRVSMDRPCLPARYGGRIVWPVGTFDTVVWNPEIDLIQGNGCIDSVRRAFLYTKSPCLREWADWILGRLHSQSEGVEEWQRIVLKHWSRALIGRFAMQYKSWIQFAET